MDKGSPPCLSSCRKRWIRRSPAPPFFWSSRPAGLHPFREIRGQHHAPATPGDLLFHMRATRLDMCLNWRPR
ncbi:MAG: Dyp-type peroxidase, partial [Ottowia sp.]|nr:Dyp-type peroxidase [Ottowia sp.]